MGSLLSKSQHRLELISFSMISVNKCCHGNTFSVIWTDKYFSGFFLHSIILHRSELSSFSATPCNKCSMVTLFSVSWAYKYFDGFFAFHILVHIGDDYFFKFLGHKNYFRGSLHSNPLHRVELTSFTMVYGNKCCQSNTFFCFVDL